MATRPRGSDAKPQASKPQPKAALKSPKKTGRKPTTAKPKAASGRPGSAGKAEGEAAVKAWIASVKPEHRPLVQRIDALIGKTIPGIQRHTKWRKPSNPLGTPFYGRPGQGWIVALWSFKEYVSVGFFAGASLVPPPPVPSVQVRRIDIHDESEYDERQLRSWLEQARDLPGWGKGSQELQSVG
ncbi:MAG: DUF1801 domain-containing protein [Halobacteriales archaeon]|nr:DUF1801 domain-containing protein [Halobacteriales archaeon]